MKEKELKKEVEIPEGVEVKVEGATITAKGAKGEANKVIAHPRIDISMEGNKIKISSKDATKREKTKIGTFQSHIINLIKGAQEGFVYKLKMCSGHFPMNVSNTKEEFTVKNFLGEKVPRVLKIMPGADVKIEGDFIVVESTNKEIAGQTAASIEALTKVKNKDRRIFQDGIYITEKAGKAIR